MHYYPAFVAIPYLLLYRAYKFTELPGYTATVCGGVNIFHHTIAESAVLFYVILCENSGRARSDKESAVLEEKNFSQGEG